MSLCLCGGPFAGANSVVASLWAASDTYTITLTCGLRSQPTTGVLFPDRRFETGIVTSPPVNQQSSIINRQSNGHAILLGGLHHDRRRVEEHSAFGEQAKVGYSSLSVNVDCWRPQPCGVAQEPPAIRVRTSERWAGTHDTHDTHDGLIATSESSGYTQHIIV